MDLKDKEWTFTEHVVGRKIHGQTKPQVRIFTLKDGEHLDNKLHIVEKGWIIVFRLGFDLYGKEISVYTNHPEIQQPDYNKNEYRKLKWYHDIDWEPNEGYNFNDIGKNYAPLSIIQPGAFRYYFTEKRGDSVKTIGSGFFNVNPVLAVGYNEERMLYLDSIQCQTVLSKCLGLFEDWPNRLIVTKECGYNAIHFTPVQVLGSSNSAYSIKDHLNINPAFGEGDLVPSYHDIYNLTKAIEEEWDMLSFTDVILNHTSSDTPWLREHPACSYNMTNSPHLIPAAILDGYLHVFGKKLGQGLYEHQGMSKQIATEDHLRAVQLFLEGEFMEIMRLEEFFMCNVEKIVNDFKILIQDSVPTEGEANTDDLVLKTDPSLGRKGATVDMELIVRLFNKKSLAYPTEDVRIMKCMRNLRNFLNEKNATESRIIRDHVKAAINNCISTIRYQRILADGPRIDEVSEQYPLLPRYFTGEFTDFEELEQEVLTRGNTVMAYNGWVANFDPLKNFADPESNVYLRRELNVWQDCVKLRYGNSPEDCPFLWAHMRKYVEISAEVFQGFRLDNCHSTPLPVAEYMMDCARLIRPDIYIMAELFTDSSELDNIFINRIGITSVVREEMRAWNLKELTRTIYRHGGEPIGSFIKHYVQSIAPVMPQVVFYDVTHDNESQIEKRSVFHCLPCTALVNMSCCATGSTRGFDELVPHRIDVVNENRFYLSWSDEIVARLNEVNIEYGIIRVKMLLNLLHKKLNDEGYNEISIKQIDEGIISLTRHNPLTHHSIILIAYPAYTYPEDISTSSEPKALKVEGVITNIILEASLTNVGEWSYFCKPKYFAKDVDYINGLWEFKGRLKENITVERSAFLTASPEQDEFSSEYTLQFFLPGSIILAEVSQKPAVRPRVEFMLNVANALKERECESILGITARTNLNDMNYVLYSCNEEGLEGGCGSYHVPGSGSLVYCGLHGFFTMLLDIKNEGDINHPFFINLRHGDWMLDYISERLKNNPHTLELGLWMEDVFETLKSIPRYLIPRYFDYIICSIIYLLKWNAKNLMSDFVREGSNFLWSLAMGSVQCVGDMGSATLPPLSTSLLNFSQRLKDLTMCAGLPYFSSGYLRCWGRDTFISLRGILLLTGRYDIARAHILGFAGCIRHGLIPNLLDSGLNPRYNSRDAVWWWLYSIVSYVKLAPAGFHILGDPVSRFYPTDDSPRMRTGLIDQPLEKVMQEVLNRHFNGINFREINAGPGLDPHMKDEGFNVRIGVDLNTGFVYGGNEHNCGTWMDKMGTSKAAGIDGKPATPRDGSAVELVALCKNVLHELANFHDRHIYSYDSVKKTTEGGETITWTYREWEKKIAENFEKCFWVDEDYDCEEDSYLVHQLRIFKDTYRSSRRWADFQLRCNFPIALALAPEMVNPEKAWKSLEVVEQKLLGPLGIKTLDPSDWNYSGNYNSGNNSRDPKVAQGFNYHQGPEWLWPVGYYLRAKLHFAKLRGPEELKKALEKVWAHLGRLYEKLRSTQWRALPELTNTNGAHCVSSCYVQSWSMASIIEVLYDLENLTIPPAQGDPEPVAPSE